MNALMNDWLRARTVVDVRGPSIETIPAGTVCEVRAKDFSPKNTSKLVDCRGAGGEKMSISILWRREVELV